MCAARSYEAHEASRPRLVLAQGHSQSLVKARATASHSAQSKHLARQGQPAALYSHPVTMNHVQHATHTSKLDATCRRYGHGRHPRASWNMMNIHALLSAPP